MNVDESVMVTHAPDVEPVVIVPLYTEVILLIKIQSVVLLNVLLVVLPK